MSSVITGSTRDEDNCCLMMCLHHLTRQNGTKQMLDQTNPTTSFALYFCLTSFYCIITSAKEVIRLSVRLLCMLCIVSLLPIHTLKYLDPGIAWKTLYLCLAEVCTVPLLFYCFFSFFHHLSIENNIVRNDFSQWKVSVPWHSFFFLNITKCCSTTLSSYMQRSLAAEIVA